MRLDLDRDLQLGIGKVDAADKAECIPHLHLPRLGRVERTNGLRQVMAPQQPAQPRLQGTVRRGTTSPRASSSCPSAAGPPAAAPAESLHPRPQPVYRCQALPQGGVERLLEALLRDDGTNIEQRTGRSCRGNRADSHDIRGGQAQALMETNYLRRGPFRGGGRDLDDVPRVTFDPRSFNAARCEATPEAHMQAAISR